MRHILFWLITALCVPASADLYWTQAPNGLTVADPLWAWDKDVDGSEIAPRVRWMVSVGDAVDWENSNWQPLTGWSNWTTDRTITRETQIGRLTLGDILDANPATAGAWCQIVLTDGLLSIWSVWKNPAAIAGAETSATPEFWGIGLEDKDGNAPERKADWCGVRVIPWRASDVKMRVVITIQGTVPPETDSPLFDWTLSVDSKFIDGGRLPYEKLQDGRYSQTVTMEITRQDAVLEQSYLFSASTIARGTGRAPITDMTPATCIWTFIEKHNDRDEQPVKIFTRE